MITGSRAFPRLRVLHKSPFSRASPLLSSAFLYSNPHSPIQRAMVSFDTIVASNARIKSELPDELVAVFPGGTSGVGEAALKRFAKHVAKPRVYFIGRVQEAGERIASECKAINPDGSYTFMKADLSLIKNVDRVCDEIKAKEKSINLLFMSIGSFAFGKKTEEGLVVTIALVHYARNRFALNLLPQLQSASALRRVVSVFAATKEGPVNTDDWQLERASPRQFAAYRGHAASMVSMSMEQIARRAPDVSFVHGFPGFVRGGITREAPWFVRIPAETITAIIGRWSCIPPDRSGDFHTYLATSARYPAREPPAGVSQGASVESDKEVCKGSDAQPGSGVYVVQEFGETSDKTLEILKGLRDDKVPEKLWEHTQGEYKRILETK